MNILIVTHEIAPERIGGSETQTLAMATELAKNHEVTVIVKRRENCPRIEKRNGFLIKRLGKKLSLPIPTFSFTAAVLAEVKKERRHIDIVFAKTITNGFIVSLAQRVFKIPAAVLIEGEQEYRNQNLVHQFLLRYVSKKTKLVAQTQEIQKELLIRTGAEAEVIANGVYLSQEIARGDHVLYVGRLIRNKVNDKGVRYLIEAAKETGLETLLIGDGPERASLEKRAEGHKNIHFLGEVSPGEVNRYLQRGFVLVLPSLYGEGLPNAILEAMAVGLPVVATRTAGITDVIQHGRTGFLIEPGKTAEIKHYLQVLRQDRLLWRTVSENSRQEAKKYEWHTIAKKFEEFFRETARSS